MPVAVWHWLEVSKTTFSQKAYSTPTPHHLGICMRLIPYMTYTIICLQTRIAFAPLK